MDTDKQPAATSGHNTSGTSTPSAPTRPNPTWPGFLLGVVVTLVVVAVAARMLLPRVDSLDTLIAWSDPGFWFLGGLAFLGAALFTRADSRTSGRNRWAPWIQLVIALMWFAMAFTAVP